MADDADTRDTIKRFIVTSPPGEEEDVIKALSTIQGGLDPELRAQSLHDLHVNSYAVVKIPDSPDRALLTPFGEIDPSHYIDPYGGRLITYDHSSNTVQDVRNLEKSELSGHESLRKLVETAFNQYLVKHYPDGVASVYASEADGGKKAVVIAVNSTKLNPISFWGGRWKSTWVLVFNNQADVAISGTLEVNVHFFEQGNVHLSTHDDFKFSVPGKGTPESVAEAVVKKIEDEEFKYESAVEESFLRLSESSYKHLRMQLPRSKVLINWDTFALQGKVGGGK